VVNLPQQAAKPSPERPLGGRYQVMQQLGQGGFGQTFLAHDLHLPGNPVCVLKQLKPQTTDEASLQTARRLFDMEAQVLYRLGHHDQIPRLLAHFEEGQDFYLSQEFIEGQPLDQLLQAGQPWPWPRVLALVHDLLQVLAYVHSERVIHRDIKPSNLICRRQDGRVVLIDFGAVKQMSTQLLKPQAQASHLTISIGTQGYMPNEQLGGTPRYSSDLYAVGMMAIQALTGLTPKHLRLDPRTSEVLWRDQVPGVEPAVAEWLDRLVRYDFRARYSTATEALGALQALATAQNLSLSEPWHQAGELAAPLTEVMASETLVTETLATETLATETLATETLATETLAAGRRSPTPSAQPPQGAVTDSPATQVAVGLYRTGRSVSDRQPQGSTLAVPPEPTPTPRRWYWLGVLVAVGLGLLGLRTCAGAPPTPESPAVAEGDPNPVALLEQGEEQRQAGDYAQALDTYDQAIAEQPDNPQAHWGRCYSLNQLGDPEAAIAACDQAIALDPQDPRPLSSKGFSLQQQQRYAEALDFFDQAIALEPQNPEAWNNRGATLLALQQPEAAVEAFDRALDLSPTFAEAWNNRGAALWSLREFDGAIASIDRALELNPDYRDALTLRQQARTQLGR
jgi:serine/threonine protein kinase/Flp pilus assembly protein TadD